MGDFAVYGIAQAAIQIRGLELKKSFKSIE